jgi:Pyridine nucleotide-disulphide oxidoreductase
VPKTDKPRIVILGSGWGAISFMKALHKKTAAKYDVILLSPRNYFLYTPLLPAVATGTMEERSIVEPIRGAMFGKGAFYEAECQSVDPVKKELIACFPKDAGFPESCFRMGYDHLIVSVGSVNNTFGIKGVAEHCFFFKAIEDASRLRSQVSECFERASLPYTSDEVRNLYACHMHPAYRAYFKLPVPAPATAVPSADKSAHQHETQRKCHAGAQEDALVRHRRRRANGHRGRGGDVRHGHAGHEAPLPAAHGLRQDQSDRADGPRAEHV